MVSVRYWRRRVVEKAGAGAAGPRVIITRAQEHFDIRLF